MKPEYWKQATNELNLCDSTMRKIIQQLDDSALNSRGDAFITLARSIVGQQISVKAAENIWQRILTVIPNASPQHFLITEQSTLRLCGLSYRKIAYLQDLAQHFENGNLNETNWKEIDDETIITQLTQVRGIGRWTAEMFLIFHIMRPDVLPLDDIGLQRAISQHYNNNQPINRKEMRELAEPWRPWRSVATWYLWRSLDPLPVEY